MDPSETQCPPLAEWLRDNVAGSESVLDVGCGNKWYWPFLSPSQICGMDIWPSAKPTVVHDAGLAPWPFPDNDFSAVLMIDVIEHLEKNRGYVALVEAMRTADRIILLTPLWWDENRKSYEDAGFYHRNPHIIHRSLWLETDFSIHPHVGATIDPGATSEGLSGFSPENRVSSGVGQPRGFWRRLDLNGMKRYFFGEWNRI